MVSYGTRLTQNWSDEYPDPVRTLDNAKLTIKPQANYKVSNNATAGIEIEITEDKNRLYNDTNHIRDVRIWVQFMFGGGKSVGGRSFTGDSFDRGTTNPRIPTR